MLALVAIAFVVVGITALAVAATIGRVTGALTRYTDVRIPPIPVGPQTTFVFDRHGKPVTTLHAEVNRTIVPLGQISPNLQDAVVAVEDRDFYRHGALDAVAIFRAAYENALNGRILQGGSTITQQLAKNLFTSGARTLPRKVHEAVLAVKLEKRYTKRQILSMYLNTVYFGHGAYGAQAAAETYFGVPAGRLKPLPAATLAGIIAAPGQFDPATHPQDALARRNLVLKDLGQQGYITPTQASRLEGKRLKVPGLAHPQPTLYPYFMDTVTQRLLNLTGYTKTFEGGLRVTTTLDQKDQQAAERAVSSELPSPSDPSAALVAIDPATGEIRALVGGRDFDKQKFNLATQAHRQTGSAAKTFTLTAAMEQGISLKSTWSGPPHLIVDDPRCMDPKTGKPWDVSNFADESAGTMSLLDATAHSVNTIFAQLVLDVGPDQVVKAAKALGVRTRLQAVCSITLGSQAVTPLDMATAYATLADRGVRHDTQVVSSIRDASGHVLWRDGSKGVRAVPENDADLVTYALQGVVTHGTGTAATLPRRPVAGKTGTGQSFRDAWFCGYTPQLAACVWVGYKKGEISMHNVEGYADVFGGSIPARIWHDFMSTAMAGQRVLDFPTPDFSRNTLNPKHSVTLPPPSPSPSPKRSHCPPILPRCRKHGPSRPSPSPSGAASGAVVMVPLSGAAVLGACAAGRRRRRSRRSGPHSQPRSK